MKQFPESEEAGHGRAMQLVEDMHKTVHQESAFGTKTICYLIVTHGPLIGDALSIVKE